MEKDRIGKFKINSVYWGDSLILMEDIPENSIDLIITDPPFGIDFKAKRSNYNRKQENVLEGYNEIPKEKYLEFSKKWISQCFKILKDTGSIYIISGWTNLKDILIAVEHLPFKILNHIIWKYQFGVYTKKRFVTSHYHIIFAVKNEKKYKFNKIEHYPEDVWIINREYWKDEIKTPTRLPEALVEKMILYSSDKNDLVFDPFLGSGTVAFCAKKLKRRYLGFEIVKEYVEFSKKRLKKIKDDLDYKVKIQDNLLQK